MIYQEIEKKKNQKNKQPYKKHSQKNDRAHLYGAFLQSLQRHTATVKWVGKQLIRDLCIEEK